MTRKRFIKLVMSCEVQKREAQKLALHYYTENFSYEDAFSIFCCTRFRAATLEAELKSKKAIEAMKFLADAVCEMGAEARETEKTMTVFFDGRATDGKTD